MSLRLAYVAVLRVFGWLALLTHSDRAKDADIPILRHQVAAFHCCHRGCRRGYRRSVAAVPFVFAVSTSPAVANLLTSHMA